MAGRQLQQGKHDKRLKVRVSRLWKTCNYKKAGELMSVDFVVIDERGDDMFCSIRSRHIPDFAGLIEEGRVYSVKNFRVESLKPLYRVLRQDNYILFDASTFVEEIVTNIPEILMFKFDIVPFPQLLEYGSDRQNLCDVLGFLVGISPIGERLRNKRHIKLQDLMLMDAGGNRLKVTLWGDDLVNSSDVSKLGESRVWLITSTIVRQDDSGLYIDLNDCFNEELRFEN